MIDSAAFYDYNSYSKKIQPGNRFIAVLFKGRNQSDLITPEISCNEIVRVNIVRNRLPSKCICCSTFFTDINIIAAVEANI